MYAVICKAKTRQLDSGEAYEWSITGSNVDGSYSIANGVDWVGSYNGNQLAGWFSNGGFMSGLADLSLVAINHHAVGVINVGQVVRVQDFGPLITGTSDVYRASDASRYDWQNNASFSVVDTAVVPVPPALPMLIAGLAGLSLRGRRLR